MPCSKPVRRPMTCWWMMETPLQLEGFHIKRLSVSENPAYVDRLEFEGNLTIEPEVMVHKSDANRFVLVLRIGWHPNGGAEDRLPYDVDVEGEAFFRLEEQRNLDEKPTDRSLLLNGSAILFGLLRAQVAQITALGANGMVLLPPVNLVGTLKRRLRNKRRRDGGRSLAVGEVRPPDARR
jgi:preprotein translocase subunit SecB